MASNTIYLNSKRYKIEYELGNSNHSTVYKALDLKENPPKDVAIKEIKMPVRKDYENRKKKLDAKLQRIEKLEDKIDLYEKFISEEINHTENNFLNAIIKSKEAITTAFFKNYPFIIQYYDSFYEDEKFFIVMEYCENGSLEIIVKKEKQIEESTALKWLSQAAVALSCIHENNILHRDIKPLNIFLNNDEIRLGDFGISHFLNRSYAEYYVGTIPYMSPEIRNNSRYNKKSDIWALGKTFHELCTLQTNILDSQNNFIDLPKRFSREFNHLIKKMLSNDANLRPSAEDINNEIEQKLNFKSIQKIMKNINKFLNNPNSEKITENLINELVSFTHDKKRNEEMGHSSKTFTEIQKELKSFPRYQINFENINKIKYTTSIDHKERITKALKSTFKTIDFKELFVNLDRNIIPPEFQNPIKNKEIIQQYKLLRYYYGVVWGDGRTDYLLIAWNFDNESIENFIKPGFFLFVDWKDFDECFFEASNDN